MTWLPEIRNKFCYNTEFWDLSDFFSRLYSSGTCQNSPFNVKVSYYFTPLTFKVNKKKCLVDLFDVWKQLILERWTEFEKRPPVGQGGKASNKITVSCNQWTSWYTSVGRLERLSELVKSHDRRITAETQGFWSKAMPLHLITPLSSWERAPGFTLGTYMDWKPDHQKTGDHVIWGVC